MRAVIRRLSLTLLVAVAALGWSSSVPASALPCQAPVNRICSVCSSLACYP